MEKAVKRKIANLLFFRAHAERLPFMFARGRNRLSLPLLSRTPGRKKKQWKNRFLTARDARPHRAGGEKRRDLSHQDGSSGLFRVDARALAQCEREHGKLWEVVEQTRDLHAGNPSATELQNPGSHAL